MIKSINRRIKVATLQSQNRRRLKETPKDMVDPSENKIKDRC